MPQKEKEEGVGRKVGAPGSVLARRLRVDTVPGPGRTFSSRTSPRRRSNPRAQGAQEGFVLSFHVESPEKGLQVPYSAGQVIKQGQVPHLCTKGQLPMKSPRTQRRPHGTCNSTADGRAHLGACNWLVSAETQHDPVLCTAAPEGEHSFRLHPGRGTAPARWTMVLGFMSPELVLHLD